MKDPRPDIQAAQRIAEAVGITDVSCRTCLSYTPWYQGPEYDWDCEPATCETHPPYANLRSFPFQKVMPCWHPDFCHSNFAGEEYDDDGELRDEVFTAFRDAVNAAADCLTKGKGR
jgi:hypothetical protein